MAGLAWGLEHCLALTERGGVLSWGGNGRGQLGLGGGVRSSRVPVELPGLSQVTSVACGQDFSLALTRHEVNIAQHLCIYKSCKPALRIIERDSGSILIEVKLYLPNIF